MENAIKKTKKSGIIRIASSKWLGTNVVKVVVAEPVVLQIA